MTEDVDSGRRSLDSPEIDLPPGKYQVTIEVASGATQNREFEVAADETWGGTRALVPALSRNRSKLRPRLERSRVISAFTRVLTRYARDKSNG